MIRNVFVRAAYNYDVEAASDESGLVCPEPTLAKQAFAEEVDINTIVKRFGLTGELPEGVRAPMYGDFTGVPLDYHTAANLIAQANEAFDAMPAEVRARFQNDPAQFADFFNDEKNREEAVRLGLVVPAPKVEAPAPLEVRVVPDASKEAAPAAGSTVPPT